MSRTTPLGFKTRNRASYNKSLRRRASLKVWFDPAMTWEAVPAGRRFRRQDYGDAAIRKCLTLKVLSGIELCQTTGFVESLMRLIGQDGARFQHPVPAPEYPEG